MPGLGSRRCQNARCRLATGEDNRRPAPLARPQGFWRCGVEGCRHGETRSCHRGTNRLDGLRRCALNKRRLGPCLSEGTPCCAAASARAISGASALGARSTVTARWATSRAESPAGESRKPKITTRWIPSDSRKAGGSPARGARTTTGVARFRRPLLSGASCRAAGRQYLGRFPPRFPGGRSGW